MSTDIKPTDFGLSKDGVLTLDQVQLAIRATGRSFTGEILTEYINIMINQHYVFTQ